MSYSSRPGLIIAASSARPAFHSSRSIRARRAASPRPPASLRRPTALDAAMLARMGAVLELKVRPARSQALLELRELYVAREALVKDRTAAKNRGKVLTLSMLKALQRSAARTNRSTDCDRRSGNSRDCRSRRQPLGSLRHPDQHSRRLHHHRLRPADRNARTRRSRSGPSGKSRRADADRAPVWTRLRSWRPRQRAPGSLYASARRHSFQS